MTQYLGLFMHCAHSGLFNFKYYVIRYCGYSSALAVLGGSVLGILPVCTGNIDFALPGLVLLELCCQRSIQREKRMVDRRQ